MKKCMHCGQDNEPTALRCVCGQDLPPDTAPAPDAATETAPGAPTAEPPSSPTGEPRLLLRKLLFVLGAVMLVFLYGMLRHRLHVNPLNGSLVGTGLFGASAVGALWFLGREKRPALRAWRILFAARAIFLTPLILNIADGLAEHGWPSGRGNRPIAHIVLLVILLAVSAFITGLCALIRTYRVAGVLAVVAGLASGVVGALLIPATASFRHRSIVLGDVLNNVMFAAKVETYISIPLGIVFIAGGIMTLRAALAQRRIAQLRR
jgi:hypothetical protein